ncbi:hypothetical protein MSAN_00459600 [Mycena sanguinolenta]|uniref:Uncharacterized protein n=1 Tax=Mycena sanguinolenta TaxID=230812 RepID=A0A8H7DJL0_9AGAR|nr:hypothetical protein MSAN_00459600 [Mycena sanguinolenta]
MSSPGSFSNADVSKSFQEQAGMRWNLSKSKSSESDPKLVPAESGANTGTIINYISGGQGGSGGGGGVQGQGDAVALLLASACQEVSPANELLAAEIVKELAFLPLAIVQAGAFISESGALDSYLALYKKHKAQLLSFQPKP